MKNTIPVVLAASLFCFASCSKTNDTTAAENNKTQNTALPVNSPTVNTTTPVMTQPTPAGQPAQASQPVVAAGLNPAHGQPGHRCDIQVGAPLNSPPQTTATPGAAPAGLPPAPVLPSAPPISTAKGLNPPHGQPGHDCSIAVGAPLKK
ncbi:hypothetical protein [Rufibacter sp. XAAS-G3-1]|uniref:hypothetical protein n=1 Tax=Rufibacter sp. XAAS-G3-1 TaxID=2729134 RepID=UPI0015E64623|nr:hypothetical protein [Rufibacter sp. XAAS-G3-1]